MAHFILAIEIETGRSMRSIVVSFDLLNEGMVFGLKNKEDNREFADSTHLCFFPCA